MLNDGFRIFQAFSWPYVNSNSLVSGIYLVFIMDVTRFLPNATKLKEWGTKFIAPVLCKMEVPSSADVDMMLQL